MFEAIKKEHGNEASYECREINNVVIDGVLFTESTLRAAVRNNPYTRLNMCLDVIFGKKKLNILEVGVNQGKLIESILPRKDGVEVYAVEPNPDVITDLQKKFPPNVHIYNIGLGNKTGEGILHITKEARNSSQFKPNMNSVHLKRENFQKTGLDGFEVVKTAPFRIVEGDWLLKKIGIDEIDLMSVNTQGSEFQILEGTKNFLSSGRVKSILIENDLDDRYLGAKDDFADQQLFLRDNGFKLFDFILIRDLMPVGIRRIYPLYIHESADPERHMAQKSSQR